MDIPVLFEEVHVMQCEIAGPPWPRAGLCQIERSGPNHVVAKVERHGQDQLKDLLCRAENQLVEILMRHVQWDIVQMDVVKTLPQNVCSSVFVADCRSASSSGSGG